MIRTYKYRLYPTNAQDKGLDFLLWQGRTLYNAALEQRIVAYQERGLAVRYPDQWAYFRDLRHEQPDTLGKLNATSIQQLLRRLDKAFTAFFRRQFHRRRRLVRSADGIEKAGEEPGFPRFKGANRFRSLEYRYGDGCKLRTDEHGRPMLYVQNVGDIKVKYHRPLPDGCEIKHVVIKRSLRKWYVCLMIELPDVERPTYTGEHVGIDVGLLSLLAFSDGTALDNPRWLRQSLARLRIAERRKSRRKLGSQRRRKAAYQVACLHDKVANQRADFWHKATRKLANTYSLIAIEDLTLGFMTQNQHLALSAHDAALGTFRQLLGYKVEETGSQLVPVSPQYTSQECSGCGWLVPKALSERVHRCPNPECLLVLDRDINAARNILKGALELLGLSSQDGTWAAAPCVS